LNFRPFSPCPVRIASCSGGTLSFFSLHRMSAGAISLCAFDVRFSRAFYWFEMFCFFSLFLLSARKDRYSEVFVALFPPLFYEVLEAVFSPPCSVSFLSFSHCFFFPPDSAHRGGLGDLFWFTFRFWCAVLVWFRPPFSFLFERVTSFTFDRFFSCRFLGGGVHAPFCPQKTKVSVQTWKFISSRFLFTSFSFFFSSPLPCSFFFVERCKLTEYSLL